MNDFDSISADNAPESPEAECPRCGDGRPLPIAYGYPGPHMSEAVERGEIVLGGCEVSDSSPDWACQQCGLEWADGSGPSIEGVAAIWIDRQDESRE